MFVLIVAECTIIINLLKIQLIHFLLPQVILCYFSNRLLKYKRRYARYLEALEMVMPRLVDVVLLMSMIYYFFAVIGMEYLHGVVHKGCW